MHTVTPHEIRQRILKHKSDVVNFKSKIGYTTRDSPENTETNILSSISLFLLGYTTRDSPENTETREHVHARSILIFVTPHEIRQRILKRRMQIRINNAGQELHHTRFAREY